MNIFEQYGIKEVADVTLYSIHKKKDGSGELYYVPALYLDTLKISSIEKTAENVWAQGGLGNSRLICWDYGKQINLTLEDALCTPASLGMCWGGILGADWKDGHINQDFGITCDRNAVEKISRMEKAFYPRNDRENALVGRLIPSIAENDYKTEISSELPAKSSIVDGTKIDGFGYVNNKSYKWIMKIESGAKAIGQIPSKIFDWAGNSYKVDSSAIICHKYASKAEIKHCVIYRINPTSSDSERYKEQIIVNTDELVDTDSTTTTTNIANAKFLRIMVDNNDNYTAYTTSEDITNPHTNMTNDTHKWVLNTAVNTDQFKNLDMYVEFNSINELIYYLITKYEDNISDINVKDIEFSNQSLDSMDDNTGEPVSDAKYNGRLWAYVNPKTMQPYDDDYWFHQGEPYYKKSLTIADKANNKKLKSQKITITAGQFPGMYMIVGETYIRSRDTGEDERMQLKFPLCKIKSD